MTSTPPNPPRHDFEGDYRPADSENPHAYLDPLNARVEPADFTYLVRLTDALNTTLDLQTLLNRTSELVRAVIDYRIFAILLLNDRTQELRMRFQIGHTPEAQRMRVPSRQRRRRPGRAHPPAASCSTTSPPMRTTSPPTPTSAPSWPFRSSPKTASSA